MNVTKEMTGDLTAEIRIDFTVADYQKNVDEQLRKYRKEAKMPGFRPGQVPMGLIKRMYEKHTRADEIQKRLSTELYNFIEAEQIQLFGEPLPIEDKNAKVDIENEGDYTFYFEIGIQPSFEIDLNSIKSTYYTIEPTEEMLNKFVEDIRRRFGKFESPETIGESDLVYGEIIECDSEGKAKEDAKPIKTSFAVDTIALATIKKNIIGSKVGESICFNIHKAFKNQADRAAMLRMDAEQADNITEVLFTVSSISRITLAELNEEFFEKAYPNQEITTLEGFKNRAKQDLSSTYAKEADRYFLNEISTTLVEQIKFEMPDEFIKRWLIASSTQEAEKEKILTNYQSYHDSIKWQLIEGKIVQNHKLEVSDEEIKHYYKTALLGNYYPVMEGETEEEKQKREESMNSVAQNLLQNKEQTKQVFDYLFDNKLIECLKSEIKSDQKTITIDEFAELVKQKNK